MGDRPLSHSKWRNATQGVTPSGTEDFAHKPAPFFTSTAKKTGWNYSFWNPPTLTRSPDRVKMLRKYMPGTSFRTSTSTLRELRPKCSTDTWAMERSTVPLIQSVAPSGMGWASRTLSFTCAGFG
jgi:hypothetical protein